MQIGHETAGHGDPVPHAQTITVHVNEQPVRMIGHRQTGLEIKEAAIKQGVKIQLDFLLYLERPHQANKPVDDAEEVTITEHSRFRAIADDDNS